MNRSEAFLLWTLCYFAALTAFAARIAHQLFSLGSEPPEDPVELAHWRRRRRWLMTSEFSALPMFATLSVLAAEQGWVSPVTAVIAALCAGALGFAFFLHALEAVVMRRINS
ncbi:hypothetical protein HMF7854_04515 [Sphingomonas ginkgonis]|uniref:Uncharacterized protein n=1 Tax=Sphingomonas ginkgonis TaxID=2315330 RepID=A0A429V8F1_9SPHN|nr:hypothetical protein [Sphingomonas ginkgonis]RST30172.1 hypothetical protein HMF7854_04515 [Sphingomonas ginkgonis]